MSAGAKRDRARNRARPLARDAAAVVAAFHDPLAVGGPTRDHADVMRPHHDHAYPGAGRTTPMRPVAREVVLGTRIAADQAAREPAAPGARTPAAHAGARKGAMLGEGFASLATPTPARRASESDRLRARGPGPMSPGGDALANRREADDRMLPVSRECRMVMTISRLRRGGRQDECQRGCAEKPNHDDTP